MNFDWKATLPVFDFHPRMLFSMEKFLFCGWPTLVQSHLFPKLAASNYKNYWSHAGQVKRKVHCVKFLLNLTPLGLPHIKKDRFWSMAKSTWKSKFHLTYLRGLFKSCYARISRSLVLTRINLKTCRII